MKKGTFLLLLILGLSVASFAQSHHHDDNSQYYFYPDINLYYSPVHRSYSYYDEGAWHTNPHLPEHYNLNNNMRRVIVHSNGYNVWQDNAAHRRQYVVQEHAQRNNSYGNPHNAYGNSGYVQNGHGARKIKIKH